MSIPSILINDNAGDYVLLLLILCGFYPFTDGGWFLQLTGPECQATCDSVLDPFTPYHQLS